MIQSIINNLITKELTINAPSIQCLVLDKDDAFFEIQSNCLFELRSTDQKKMTCNSFLEYFGDEITVADWNYKFFLEKLLDPKVYGIILELKDGTLLNLLNHQIYFPDVKNFIFQLDISKIHTYYSEWYMRPEKEPNLVRVYNIMLLQNHIKSSLKPVNILSNGYDITLDDSIRGRTLEDSLVLPNENSVILFTVSFLVSDGNVFPYYAIYEASSRLRAKPVTDFLSGNIKIGEDNKVCFGNAQKTLENLYNVMDKLNAGSTFFDRYVPIPEHGRDQVTAFKLSLYGHLTGTLEEIMRNTRDKALANQQVIYS